MMPLGRAKGDLQRTPSELEVLRIPLLRTPLNKGRSCTAESVSEKVRLQSLSSQPWATKVTSHVGTQQAAGGMREDGRSPKRRPTPEDVAVHGYRALRAPSGPKRHHLRDRRAYGCFPRNRIEHTHRARLRRADLGAWHGVLRLRLGAAAHPILLGLGDLRAHDAAAS